jgi:hypothetical protein
MWNHLDKSHGSTRTETVVAHNREAAIQKAFVRHYFPNKLFAPPTQILILDEKGNYYIAYHLRGRRYLLVKAKTKKQIRDECKDPHTFYPPIWVEKITTVPPR